MYIYIYNPSAPVCKWGCSMRMKICLSLYLSSQLEPRIAAVPSIADGRSSCEDLESFDESRDIGSAEKCGYYIYIYISYIYIYTVHIYIYTYMYILLHWQILAMWHYHGKTLQHHQQSSPLAPSQESLHEPA